MEGHSKFLAPLCQSNFLAYLLIMTVKLYTNNLGNAVCTCCTYLHSLISTNHGRHRLALFGVESVVDDGSIFERALARLGILEWEGMLPPVLWERLLFLTFQGLLVVVLVNPGTRIVSIFSTTRSALQDSAWFCSFIAYVWNLEVSCPHDLSIRYSNIL